MWKLNIILYIPSPSPLSTMSSQFTAKMQQTKANAKEKKLFRLNIWKRYFSFNKFNKLSAKENVQEYIK